MSTAGKTYGRTASGKQITDELIEVLVRKAEAGYEIEELTESMDIADAKAKLDAALDEPAAAGFSVWGGTTGRSRSGNSTGRAPSAHPLRDG